MTDYHGAMPSVIAEKHETALTENQHTKRQLPRLIKDRHFWYIALLAFFTGAFACIATINGSASREGGEIAHYVAIYRFSYVVSVAVAAWRFGVKAGLTVCLTLAPIILAVIIVNPSVPNTWLEIGLIVVGIVFSWLIGRQGEMKILLEQKTEDLRQQAVRLRVEIEQRKLAEEEIRDSEARYRLLAENATDVIWTVNINSPDRLTYISPSVKRLLGYSVEEAKMKTMEEVFAPASHELVSKAITEELVIENSEQKNLSRSRTLELELNCKDGTTVPVEINCNFIRGSDDRAVGILVIARDITERKQMEEQLILTDRLASIGELASGIAHELNNPLTGVIGMSQLLIQGDVAEDIKEDLNLVYSEARRAANVVKNLLTFARKHAPAKELLNINDVIGKVLELRTYEERVNNIEVVADLTSDLPQIMADYFQLQQVFLNIVINAEHFMVASHNKGTFTITTERKGDVVKVSFADDGPGIPKENLGHIFDPFFTTKEVGKGTGLGLSICHGIISAHSGQIYAESEPGKGTTFIVDLPICQEDQ